MNAASPVAIAVVVAYLVLNLGVGVASARRASASAEGWVAGDRAIGLLVMYFLTGATIFSAFAFLGLPGWAYSQGWKALYIPAYGAIGFVPFYFLGPRAARLGRRFGFVTQAEMVAARFSSRGIAGLMAVLSVTAFVPYLALQMKGAGIVVELITGGRVPEWAGAAVVYGVVVTYVLASGVLGVGWTNTLQGIFMLVLAWTLGLWLPYHLYGGVGPMFDAIEAARPDLLTLPGLARANGEPWPWSEYSSAVLVSAIGFCFWPHLFMKAFTAKDERTLRRTVVLYPTFQLFLIPILLIGFAGVLFHTAPAKADQILPHLLLSVELPPVVVGLFCAGALAASMSSGDAISHATASIAVRDGIVRAGGLSVDASGERRLVRIVLVVVALAAYGLFLVYDDDIVKLLLYAFGPVSQFAPAVVATLLWRRATGAGVLAGLVAGGIATLAFSAWPDARPFEVHAGLLGLAANVPVLVVVSLLTRRADDAVFLATADGDRS